MKAHQRVIREQISDEPIPQINGRDVDIDISKAIVKETSRVVAKEIIEK